MAVHDEDSFIEQLRTSMTGLAGCSQEAVNLRR
jgi:hypothetical protein